MTDEGPGNVSHESGTAEGWKKKGDEYVKANDFEHALPCYSTAVDLDPQYVSAWNNMGFAYFKLGRLDEAQTCKDTVKALQETRADDHQHGQPEPVPGAQPGHPPPAAQPAQPAPAPAPQIPEPPDSYRQNMLLIGLFLAGLACLFVPVIGFILVIFIEIASAYFVYKDAQALGAGRAPGSWSPLILGILVLLFGLIALPIYILRRKSIYEKGKAAFREGRTEINRTGGLVAVLIIIGAIVVIFIVSAIIAAAFLSPIGPTTPAGTESLKSVPALVTVGGTIAMDGNATKPRWGDLEVEDWGWTTGDRGLHYLTGTVKNVGPTNYAYAQIEFTVYDDSDAEVGSSFDTITNLEPYGTWKFKAPVVEDTATTASLKSIAAY
jgi:hypothetical protein